ncbi:MAG: thioredoxin-disulfide reductase [Patescibacteria group bacterium]
MQKLVIIGGGPAGLSAGIYASRALLEPIIIEGALPGGQLTQTTEVENFPGFPEGVFGTELISRMRKQAEKFGAKFITQDVKSVQKKGGDFEVILDDGKVLNSKSVLVTTGANANWLNLESEQRLIGKGVSGCATCDGFFFKNKTICVIGGGDSAMEEATFLTKFAQKVFIIHRKNEFRASKIMQKKVFANPKIEILWNSQVIEVLGDQKVVGVKLKNTLTNEEKVLNLDGVFLAIGHTPATSFLKNSGVLMDEKGYVLTSERVYFKNLENLKPQFSNEFRYQTNISGLFASGDCIDPDYRQAITASGMSVSAELEIEKYLSEKE